MGQHEHELQLYLPSTHSWPIRQDCKSVDAASILQVQRHEREDLGTTFAQTPVVTRSFDPALPIEDSSYLPPNKPPTEATATCVTCDVPDVPGANSMSVQLAIGHMWVSDTVAWIQNHRGHVTVLKWGNTNPGINVDLRKEIPITFLDNAPRAAEQMGNTAVGRDSRNREVACYTAPEQCSFRPESEDKPGNVEPGTVEVDLDSLAVNPQGTWKICIGDDEAGIDGEFHGFNVWIPAFDPHIPGNGDAVGDPHIDTLQGEHYLLSKQGTFSLWELSGSSEATCVEH